MTQPGPANANGGNNPRMAAANAFLVALGRRVRRVRLLAELTQADLASAAGMSRSFVSLIEHGDSSLQVFRLWRLADALRVPVAALLPDPQEYAGSIPRAAGTPLVCRECTPPEDSETQTPRSIR